MATETSVYVEAQPGQLITSAAWNEMQKKIKDDIQAQVAKAEQDVIDGGVKRADDADKFDNKTPKGWTDDLDQRYAPKVHDHEGMANYRRYFRKMDKTEETFILLEHGLGRYPLVDVYQLLPILVPTPILPQGAATQTKFLLYYGHEELDLLQTNLTSKRLPRRTLGNAWEPLLAEYQVQYTDDDSLEDLFNDFLDAFFKLPAADEMDHQVTKWIDDHRDKRTVGELKKRGEWDDIRWVVLPQKIVVGGPPAIQNTDGSMPQNPLDVTHLSYNTLAVRYGVNIQTSPTNVDLMIVLRS
jgi:hypothetical protein